MGLAAREPVEDRLDGRRPEKARQSLPAWMRIEDVGDLKRTLVEVTLVYLAFDLATDAADAGAPLTAESLVLPFSILLIAAAQRLLPGNKH